MDLSSSSGLGQFARLPTELRLQIYALCLPTTPHFLNLLSTQSNLHWLATSRQIFTEAAPLLYSNTALYFDLEPAAKTRRGSLVSELAFHVQTHFATPPPQTAAASFADKWIRRVLTRKVMVEVWCAYLDNIEEFLSWFAAGNISGFLAGCEALQEVSVSLRDIFIGPLDEGVLVLREVGDGEWVRLLREGEVPHLRRLCGKMRRVEANVPRGCVVRWSLPGETLPEVAYLREGVPEREPTGRERAVSEFMDRVWRFVREREVLELDSLLGS